jgi:hypothetical protein
MATIHDDSNIVESGERGISQGKAYQSDRERDRGMRGPGLLHL